MAKKLKALIKDMPSTKDKMIEFFQAKGLNDYEIELLVRIYFDKQSLSYISYAMDFAKYGKPQKYYSVRSLNNFHKEAVIKIIMNK